MPEPGTQGARLKRLPLDPGSPAAYGFGLARNHAFIDGNKRIAFIAMALFLQLNGHRLVAANDDAAAVVLRLAAAPDKDA